MSLPVRGAWIEISIFPDNSSKVMSLPVRGAWIEIGCQSLRFVNATVAPRKGIEIRVSGNDWSFAVVAPRKGSVD